MITYRLMEEGCLLTTCLHRGPRPLAEALDAGTDPAWLETDAGLPTGTVARALGSLCREYGACGVLAVDGSLVVGKVRFGPTELCEDQPFCVQQFPERMRALSETGFAPAATLTTRALTILCVQVAEGAEYRGQGIATELIRQTVTWAVLNEWEEVRAKAMRRIRPLLDWAGLLSTDLYERLGFTREGVVSHSLLEGVRAMRRGAHGDEVRAQWEPYAGLTNEEAAEVHQMVLRPGARACG